MSIYDSSNLGYNWNNYRSSGNQLLQSGKQRLRDIGDSAGKQVRTLKNRYEAYQQEQSEEAGDNPIKHIGFGPAVGVGVGGVFALNALQRRKEIKEGSELFAKELGRMGITDENQIKEYTNLRKKLMDVKVRERGSVYENMLSRGEITPDQAQTLIRGERGLKANEAFRGAISKKLGSQGLEVFQSLRPHETLLAEAYSSITNKPTMEGFRQFLVESGNERMIPGLRMNAFENPDAMFNTMDAFRERGSLVHSGIKDFRSLPRGSRDIISSYAASNEQLTPSGLRNYAQGALDPEDFRQFSEIIDSRGNVHDILSAVKSSGNLSGVDKHVSTLLKLDQGSLNVLEEFSRGGVKDIAKLRSYVDQNGIKALKVMNDEQLKALLNPETFEKALGIAKGYKHSFRQALGGAKLTPGQVGLVRKYLIRTGNPTVEGLQMFIQGHQHGGAEVAKEVGGLLKGIGNQSGSLVQAAEIAHLMKSPNMTPVVQGQSLKSVLDGVPKYRPGLIARALGTVGKLFKKGSSSITPEQVEAVRARGAKLTQARDDAMKSVLAPVGNADFDPNNIQHLKELRRRSRGGWNEDISTYYNKFHKPGIDSKKQRFFEEAFNSNDKLKSFGRNMSEFKNAPSYYGEGMYLAPRDGDKKPVLYDSKTGKAQQLLTFEESIDDAKRDDKRRASKQWGQAAMDYVQGKRDNMDVEDLSTYTSRKGGWNAAFDGREMGKDTRNYIRRLGSGFVTAGVGGAIAGTALATAENTRNAMGYNMNGPTKDNRNIGTLSDVYGLATELNPAGLVINEAAKFADQAMDRNYYNVSESHRSNDKGIAYWALDKAREISNGYAPKEPYMLTVDKGRQIYKKPSEVRNTQSREVANDGRSDQR